MSREILQPMSSICSGSKPFRPVEHLAVHRRWNIPANKSGDSAEVKGTSCTWLYIERPLVYGYALDNTTTNSSSHIPWVYRETPLGYLIYLRKSLWSSCLEPYTKNSIQGDYYACTLEVYREWHLLDNPSERPDFLKSPCHFKSACFYL